MWAQLELIKPVNSQSILINFVGFNCPYSLEIIQKSKTIMTIITYSDNLQIFSLKTRKNSKKRTKVSIYRRQKPWLNRNYKIEILVMARIFFEHALRPTAQSVNLQIRFTVANNFWFIFRLRFPPQVNISICDLSW